SCGSIGRTLGRPWKVRILEPLRPYPLRRASVPRGVSWKVRILEPLRPLSPLIVLRMSGTVTPDASSLSPAREGRSFRSDAGGEIFIYMPPQQSRPRRDGTMKSTSVLTRKIENEVELLQRHVQMLKAIREN